MDDVFKMDTLVHATSGATGGNMAMALTYPIDQIRVALQLRGKQGLKDLLGKGVGGLYQGIVPVLQCAGISNFVYFYLYVMIQTLRKRAQNVKSLSPVDNLLASSIAGALNMAITEPLWKASTIARRLLRRCNPNACLRISAHMFTHVPINVNHSHNAATKEEAATAAKAKPQPHRRFTPLSLHSTAS